MIVNEKMTKAEILGHYNLSQELLNNTTKYSEQYKNALSESLKERATLKQKVFDLEKDCETLKKKIKEIVFNQVAKLEAVKMLFSITSGAHTHRSKAMFSDQAKQMIDEEIKTTQHNAGFFNLHDGLPF